MPFKGRGPRRKSSIFSVSAGFSGYSASAATVRAATSSGTVSAAWGIAFSSSKVLGRLFNVISLIWVPPVHRGFRAIYFCLSRLACQANDYLHMKHRCSVCLSVFSQLARLLRELLTAPIAAVMVARRKYEGYLWNILSNSGYLNSRFLLP